MPLALVDEPDDFDKNPRLETVVGFCRRLRPPAKLWKSYEQNIKHREA
jgi:hypothetical protein